MKITLFALFVIAISGLLGVLIFQVTDNIIISVFIGIIVFGVLDRIISPLFLTKTKLEEEEIKEDEN